MRRMELSTQLSVKNLVKKVERYIYKDSSEFQQNISKLAQEFCDSGDQSPDCSEPISKLREEATRILKCTAARTASIKIGACLAREESIRTRNASKRLEKIYNELAVTIQSSRLSTSQISELSTSCAMHLFSPRSKTSAIGR